MQVRNEVKELRLLFEVLQILDSASDLSDNLETVLEVMAEHTGMMRGVITLLDEAHGEIAIEAAYGMSAEAQSKGRYKLGEGITGKVIESGKPLVIPNVLVEPLFLNRTGSRSRKEAVSFICVPVKREGRVIGALSADRLFAASEALEEDMRLLSVLASLISKAVKNRQERHRMLEENRRLLDVLRERSRPEMFVGRSPGLRAVLTQLAQVAPTSATVLLLGETGVGKDVIARRIHALSLRKNKTFIKVDCGSIPENLIETELFGYAAGTFSGASKTGKIGLIEAAAGGTLFLDEIGELPMPMQTRLLRFLQDWEIMRVGSTTPKQIDVRIVAATNKNLERAIARGEFRSDLYYRLKVAVIAIPPLRDRQADILPLARMFLRFYGSKYHRQLTFSEEAESLLLDYKWPGNIRELENLVQGLAVTSKNSVIRASDVPISGVAKPAASARRDGLDFELDGKTYKEIMKDLENKVLSAAMERYGSITEVAKHFQVDRSTIFRKVKELEKEGKMR